MLAEWPDTVSEGAINQSAAAMAEHAVQQQFDKLSHLEVSAMIASAVSKTAVTFGEFKTMQLTETVISRIKALNADRGYKKSRTAGTTCLPMATGGHSSNFPRARPQS